MNKKNDNKNNEKHVILRKIDVLSLIKILRNMYGAGADYIDIVGIMKGEGIQDEVMVAVKDEYMKYVDDEETREKNYLEDWEINDIDEDDDDDDIDDEEAFIKKCLKEDNVPLEQESFTESQINKLLDGSC